MFDNDFSKFDPTPGEEGPPDGNWMDSGSDDNEDDCPWAKAILAATLIPKPFGIPWDPDKVKKFLRDRGYAVIDRFDTETEEEYTIVVKPDQDYIPDSPSESNLMDTFIDEIQDIILGWLKKQ